LLWDNRLYETEERTVLEVRYVLKYALAIAWVIAIGAECFTAGLLIGRSAAESDSYGIYVLLSAVVATAAIVTAVFLSITSVSRARRRTNSRS
jgi:ABC-type nitrate/sulfonate/bicarbonate transport system permease component